MNCFFPLHIRHFLPGIDKIDPDKHSEYPGTSQFSPFFHRQNTSCFKTLCFLAWGIFQKLHTC